MYMQPSCPSGDEVGRRGFTVVSRVGPEVSVVHCCPEPLAGVSLRVGRRVVTGQCVVRGQAGDECGCIIGQGGLALFGRAAQGRGLVIVISNLPFAKTLRNLRNEKHIMRILAKLGISKPCVTRICENLGILRNKCEIRKKIFVKPSENSRILAKTRICEICET